MPEDRKAAPESPTEIAMETGMGAPGFSPRGPLEEALMAAPGLLDGRTGIRAADGRPGDGDPAPTAGAEAAALGLVPGQSGAEAVSGLPNAGSEDPWDGP